MEERRDGKARRGSASPGRRSTDPKRGTAPLRELIPWKLLLPMAFLSLLSLFSWQFSQSESIDAEDLPPVAYDRSLSTPLLSARRVPETIQQPLADRALAPELATLVAGSGPTACLVVSEGERILSTNNAQTSLVPASNQKILTTYVALDQFGPDHTFETRVATTVPLTGGVLAGDLFLIGGGDPFLSTALWRSQYGDEQLGRSFTAIEDLVDAVVATGLTEVSGGVVGDESLFDTERYGPWAERLIVSNQSGPLSALSLNEGFSAWPAEFAGSFRAREQTAEPALAAAQQFQALLAERGVTFAGDARVGSANNQAATLAAVTSPRLVETVTHINSYSSNYGAEILTKHLGQSELGLGTTAAGAARILAVLEQKGFETTGLQVDDGSGLAESNRLSCGLVAEILTDAGPDSDLVQSLSIGGERGSLLPLHEGTPADGRVFAKTGTLNGVTALSGVVESSREEGVDLTFTYIVNGESVGLNEQLKGLQVPFVEALAAYPNAPLIAQLGPG